MSYRSLVFVVVRVNMSYRSRVHVFIPSVMSVWSMKTAYEHEI